MTTKVPYKLRHVSIFRKLPKDITCSLAFHNIHHLLLDTNKKIRQQAANKYNSRGGALNWELPRVGIIANRTKEALDHAKYVTSIVGKRYEVVEYEDLRQIAKGTTLIVPYINSSAAHKELNIYDADIHQTIWGLPPLLADILGNKATLHQLIRETTLKDLHVPEFRIAQLDNFNETAQKVLDESKSLYQRFSPQYPLGLFFRTALSNGQFGNARIVQGLQGKLFITIYEEKTKKEILPSNSWEEAIRRVKKSIIKNKNNVVDPEIVISRYIDMIESPGQSIFFLNGYAIPLDWNGNLFQNGDPVSHGTTVFTTQNPEILKQLKDYQQQSGEVLSAFVKKVARKNGIPYDTMSGLLNFDLMIPGKLERELLQAQGKNIHYYIAECNPRWTNWTDALMNAVGINHQKPSIASINKIIEHGIHNIDEFPLQGANLDIFREKIYHADQKLIADGRTRVFIRVPGQNFAGIILLGDRILGEKILADAIKKAQRYAS